jgi:formylglycine-generating enzyme required for sulfatase activity
MSTLPTHAAWETTLRDAAQRSAADGKTDDADYYGYYADQHGNASLREQRGDDSCRHK